MNKKVHESIIRWRLYNHILLLVYTLSAKGIGSLLAVINQSIANK